MYAHKLGALALAIVAGSIFTVPPVMAATHDDISQRQDRHCGAEECQWYCDQMSRDRDQDRYNRDDRDDRYDRDQDQNQRQRDRDRNPNA